MDLYAVFERRAADKLDYYDWKISYMAEEEDFKIINDVEIWLENSTSDTI